MKILQKILMIMIVGVVAGSAGVKGMALPVLDFDTIAPCEAVVVKDRIAKLVNILHYKNVKEQLEQYRDIPADLMQWLEDNFDGNGIGAAYKELFNELYVIKYQFWAYQLIGKQEYSRGNLQDTSVTEDLDTDKLLQLSNNITVENDANDIRGHIDLLLRCLGGGNIGTPIKINGYHVTIRSDAFVVKKRIAHLVNLLHFKIIDNRIEQHQTVGYITNGEALSWLADDFEGNNISAAYKNIFNEAIPANYQGLADTITRTERYNYGNNKNGSVTGDCNTARLVALSNSVTITTNNNDIRGHINLLLRCLARGAIGTAIKINGHNVTIRDRLYNIPEFFKPVYISHATNPNEKYICFILTENKELIDFFRLEGRKRFIPGEKCVLFPVDGHQPTTAKAVAWSCANADAELPEEQRLNSPITEWYMQMFGVIPFQNDGSNNNDYIKAGYTPDNDARKIINFLKFDEVKVNDPDSTALTKQCEKKELFVRNFRKIASTSVGRVLLYRLLIEIRRNNGRSGCQESVLEDMKLSERNKCRSITMWWRDDFFQFIDLGFIWFAKETKPQTAISSPQKGETKVEISLQTICKPLDIALFHEMLHWFHKLKDYNKHSKESSKKNELQIRIEEFDIIQLYWGNVSSFQEGKGPWLIPNFNRSALIIAFEEIRTVLGNPRDAYGYDLSENLYRMERKFPLRFGYSDVTFRERIEVVRNVLDGVRQVSKCYFDSIPAIAFVDK